VPASNACPFRSQLVLNMTDLDTTKLAALRASLRPYWISAEAGGIFLMGDMNNDEANQAIFHKVLALFPEIEASGDGKWETLAEELCRLSLHFLEAYHLPPGAYELDNYHRALAKDGELELNQWGSPPIKVPSADRFTFQVTSEHVTLMRNMNTRTWESYIELMDLKRPYGDMTYFYIDMADALREPVPRDGEGKPMFPAEAEQRYERLHAEMLFAVQAFWNHASPKAPHQS
jgi:hypothetical protein